MGSMNDLDEDRIEEPGQSGEGNGDLLAAAHREELAWRIARAVPMDATVQPVKGLHLARVSAMTGRIHGVAHPSFCMVPQGSKEVYLGEERHRYDPYHYLLATVELPIAAQVLEASKERPYLSLRLDLDAALVASVMLEAGLPAPRRDAASVRALDVSPLGADLLDAAVRLVRLVEASPAAVRVLLPLVTREVVFHLLAGEQGARLRHIAVLGGHTERIARAIERLRSDYDKPLRIEALAKEIGMSPSAFHEHFKAVTALSPLQFQKHLRLQEARRLLLGRDVDAATAGHQVGYEDASQFSKEYKRLFGDPPLRDVERLRQNAHATTAT
ncbi:MAG TPA: AraC family transcriptional regulator [Armatimonadota bacterium]|jgi:AraC-like DNA-binding protein